MSDATVGQLGATLVRFSSRVLFYRHINSFFLTCDLGGGSVERKMTEISSYCHGTFPEIAPGQDRLLHVHKYHWTCPRL